MSDICNLTYNALQKKNNSITPLIHSEQMCVSGHSWGPGVRSYYVIHYVISGKGVFYSGTNKYELRKGQLFVIFPGTIVKYQADESEPWHYIWVTFYGDEAKGILSDIGLTYQNPVININNASEVVNTLRKMPQERGTNISENLLFTAKLYEFMSLLAANKNEEVKNENVYLETAIRYIKANYHKELSVEQVAAHAGISRKYLFAIFKKAYSVSVKDYITSYRIEKAKEFLLDKNLPIGNIAYSVGYNDQMTFSKMFKLKTGFSPSEFRLKNHF
ncbi:MAG: helix-turn-helix domain-containing protein [Ruminococcaceae bacterium]|nr:helix-turn-helix domain-containing protein [Oscillospiraceae bacterium]